MPLLSPGKALLRALTPAINPREFTLTQGSCVIGRFLTCDIVIEGSDISRKHAVISWDGSYFVLTDTSSNGTYVNGQRVTSPYILRNHDRIEARGGLELLQFTDPDGTTMAKPIFQYLKREQRFLYFDKPLQLSPTQTKLLYHLYSNFGQVCTHESCSHALWNGSFDTSRQAQLQREVSKIRTKLNEIEPAADPIKVRWGIGYYLDILDVNE